MDKSILNQSGCVDKTAHDAINRYEKEQKHYSQRKEAVEVLVQAIKNIAWLAGFKITNRIHFEDRKTGERYE